MKVFKLLLSLGLLFVLQQEDCVAVLDARFSNFVATMQDRLKLEKRPPLNFKGLQDFLRTCYAPPQEIADLIEQKKEKILQEVERGNSKFSVFNDDGLSIFYKGFGAINLKRIINAERMHACIEKYGLSCLRVARKYVYEINGVMHVFAAYIKPIENDDKQFTTEEINQLMILVAETGFRDFGNPRNNFFDNIIRDVNNNIVFIDTEDKSFRNFSQYPLADVQAHCQAQYVANMLDYLKNFIGEDLTDLINVKINDLRAQAGIMYEPILTSNRFDNDSYLATLALYLDRLYEILSPSKKCT